LLGRDRLQQYNDRGSIESRSKNPEDVADLVPFLCASASDMITSQKIAIDGGW
jgi:NAD(P)-dependent dehydrogenase (short-subunit alcohol dehydrogenase family)